MAPRIGFLIGGVQKGGTSALASFVRQHPQVRLPRDKEAHVFDAPSFDDGWDAPAVDLCYQAHFDADGAGAGLLHGDATPIYCFHPTLVRRIARYNPDMRWIIILRDPVDRAVSHYRMERARGHETWPLWRAALLERWRLAGHADDFSLDSPLRRHSYLARGDYARQLDVLFASFPRAQVLLLRNDELAAKPAQVLGQVWDFLGIPPPEVAPVFGRVFDGGHRPLPESAPVRRLLATLLRGRIRRARLRHDIHW
ncbi:sulfotransferase family protein [Pseudoxanthomonas jiangsuensis]|uniref:sulfotransferase family protein n=1 Tax=Pseudoxanthomonas jiangsuensis TaxID=619688 RepID=UPI001391AB33|nr:sulfotransferase [Pseudoxanthomonas jiangsuensis]